MASPNDGGKTRVARELDELRGKAVAKSQRGKYSAATMPLTTPEEAAAYLAAMRAAAAKKSTPTPPSNLSSADLDSWFMQQRRRDMAEKKKREEAENLLRGFRMSAAHHQMSSSMSVLNTQPTSPIAGTVDARSKVFSASTGFRPMPGQTSAEAAFAAAAIDNGGSIRFVDSQLEDFMRPDVTEGGVSVSDAISGLSVAESQAIYPGNLGTKQGNIMAIPELPGLEITEEVLELEDESQPEKEIAEIGELEDEGDPKPPEDAPELTVDKDKGEGDVVNDEDGKDTATNDEKEVLTEDPESESSPLEDKAKELNEEEKKVEEETTENSSKETTAPAPPMEVKAKTGFDDVDTKTGEFKRKDAVWRDTVSSEPGSKFPPESGRYHLYVAYGCGWAHRTLITRALKGLEDAIPITIVHPIWQRTKPNDPKDDNRGWVFGNPGGPPLKNTAGLGGPFPAAYPDNDPDPLFGSHSIRDLYERANDVGGKYTVPILWDKKQNTIVSNESSEIIRMLNSEFNELAKHPELDLYPESLRDAIDEVNDWVYPTINNAVYRCGLASSQSSYDAAIDEFTASFDRIDSILQNQRFLAGDVLTEADVRLFPTLVRHDEVYSIYFKCNTRSVTYTPAILNYCREIYQMKGVSDTVNMEQIKVHYFCSHAELNKHSIVPRGSRFVELLKQPHNRAQAEI